MPSTNVARVRFPQSASYVVEFVGSLIYSALKGFFPGTLVFPSHQKPTFDLIC